MSFVRELGREVYAAAGLRTDAPPVGGAVALAEAMFGRGCMRRRADVPTEAMLVMEGGVRRVLVRRGASTPRMHFAVARVVARAALVARELFGHVDEDRLAAYLVAPDEAFAPAFDAFGLNLAALAAPFVVTETCIALRVAEVAGIDSAIVTPSRVYRRGRALSWASDADVRLLAAKESTRSVRLIKIADERSRAALFAVG